MWQGNLISSCHNFVIHSHNIFHTSHYEKDLYLIIHIGDNIGKWILPAAMNQQWPRDENCKICQHIDISDNANMEDAYQFTPNVLVCYKQKEGDLKSIYATQRDGIDGTDWWD